MPDHPCAAVSNLALNIKKFRLQINKEHFVNCGFSKRMFLPLVLRIQTNVLVTNADFGDLIVIGVRVYHGIREVTSCIPGAQYLAAQK
jgi:hypothetical protein